MLLTSFPPQPSLGPSLWSLSDPQFSIGLSPAFKSCMMHLHLHQYLNSLLPPAETISHAQLPNAQLPFDRVDVWHSCKFPLDILGNDVDGQEGLDAVKTKTGNKGDARFDTVLVAHSDNAETTGLRGRWFSSQNWLPISDSAMTIGMKVGCLRIILKLPKVIPHLQLINVPSWPKEPLAYVEWYQLSHSPGWHHNMYSVVSLKPALRNSRIFQVTPGAVVPLKAIRQPCQLIPLEHIGDNWPTDWVSTAVLGQCSTFLLNNWSSKYAYQTIW